MRLKEVKKFLKQKKIGLFVYKNWMVTVHPSKGMSIVTFKNGQIFQYNKVILKHLTEYEFLFYL